MVLGSLVAPEEPEFYALFCTAQISAQTINDFLKVSKESRISNNIWSLIRNHDQKRADKPTDYLIEGGDFTTSFTHFTLDDFGAFCRDKFDPKKSPDPKISWEDFAVVDERTLKDGTIMLVKWELSSERIDPNSEDDSDESFEMKEGWQTIRVPLAQAADTMYGIRNLLVRDFRESLKPEDDGVYVYGAKK